MSTCACYIVLQINMKSETVSNICKYKTLSGTIWYYIIVNLFVPFPFNSCYQLLHSSVELRWVVGIANQF